MSRESSFRQRLAEAVERIGRKRVFGAGVSEGGLSKVLSGDVQNPGIFTVRSMAEACGVTVGWLLGETPYEVPEEFREPEIAAHARNLAALSEGDREAFLRLAESFAAAVTTRSRREKSRQIPVTPANPAQPSEKEGRTDMPKHPITMR